MKALLVVPPLCFLVVIVSVIAADGLALRAAFGWWGIALFVGWPAFMAFAIWRGWGDGP